MGVQLLQRVFPCNVKNISIGRTSRADLFAVLWMDTISSIRLKRITLACPGDDPVFGSSTKFGWQTWTTFAPTATGPNARSRSFTLTSKRHLDLLLRDWTTKPSLAPLRLPRDLAGDDLDQVFDVPKLLDDLLHTIPVLSFDQPREYLPDPSAQRTCLCCIVNFCHTRTGYTSATRG